MIGFQEYILTNNIKVYNIAKKINMSVSTIWRWINLNKVPEKYHDIICEKLNIDKDYINKKINDINTYQPKDKGFNHYKICGDYVIIYIQNQKGNKFETYIDLEDLDKVKSLNKAINVGYRKNNNNYYASIQIYLGIINGKKKYKTLLLHRIVTDAADDDFVDHIEQLNTLDNRKSNLRKTTNDKNLQNRKGANKNNKTGKRNIAYIESKNEYWVQHMKHGIRYKKIFLVDQFKEACDYAEKMRKELFGEFKGKE